MGMKCAITGKKPAKGRTYTYRGKAKYLGGVGKKVTGKSKRRFKPNLQKMRVQVGGTVKRLRVATSANRSGLVQKPIKRKPFEVPKM